MFNNNAVITDLYNRFVELEKFREKNYLTRVIYYGGVSIITFVAMFTFMFIMPNDIGSFFVLTFFFFWLGSFTALSSITNVKEKDILSFLWWKSERILKDMKAEMIYNIFQEKVQLELINYKFKHITSDSIMKLRKYLALKEYDNAYKSIQDILKIEAQLDAEKASEAETKRLIEEHELSLKI